MNSWFQNLGSLDWWIGVVLVGILINLASEYLKNPVDRLLVRSSTWWATRTEKQRAARELRIQKLRSSQEEQVFALLETLYSRVSSTMMVLAGGIFFVLLETLRSHAEKGGPHKLLLCGKILALFAVLLGMRGWWEVIRRRGEISEARNLKSAS